MLFVTINIEYLGNNNKIGSIKKLLKFDVFYQDMNRSSGSGQLQIKNINSCIV